MTALIDEKSGVLKKYIIKGLKSGRAHHHWVKIKGIRLIQKRIVTPGVTC